MTKPGISTLSSFITMLRQSNNAPISPYIIDEDTGIRYEVLSPDKQNIEQTAHIIAQTFAEGEPMAVCLTLTAADLMPFIHPLCKGAADLALSIIAKDKNDKIIGAIISVDTTTPPPDLDDEKIIKLLPILTLLERINQSSPFNEKITTEKTLHLFTIGVDSNPVHKGKNIAESLIYLNLALAQVKGYVNCIAEPTGPISQHLCNKIGFKQVYSLPYESFEHDGVKVFADINTCFQNTKKRGFNCTECQLVVGNIAFLLAP